MQRLHLFLLLDQTRLHRRLQNYLKIFVNIHYVLAAFVLLEFMKSHMFVSV